MERALIRLEAVGPEAYDDTLQERRTATYGNGTQRTIEKTRAALTRRLKEMQSARRSDYEKAQQEAILFPQLARLKGERPDQAKQFPSPELRVIGLRPARNRSSHRPRRPPGGRQSPRRIS
jgi:hypothetical protein